MTEPYDHHGSAKQADRLKTPGAEPSREPDWTHGLKRLYDSVLDEPVPDTFMDLLSKLDNNSK